MASPSDDELNSTTSESDDDLPTLSRIMTKSPSKCQQSTIKTADEVLTPRRTPKPTDDDELVLGSPLRSPTSSKARATKSKARSLHDLLRDKEIDDDIQSKVDDIMKMKEMELDYQEENSEERIAAGIGEGQIGDYSQEFSQDIDVLDDSNDSIEVKFSYALSRDFPDTFPGIELFVRPADDADPVILLEEVLKYFEDESIGISKVDLLDEDLSNENVHEIIAQILRDLSCQTEIKEKGLWCDVWKILYLVDDCDVCYAAFQCLASHFKMCSKNNKNPHWIPSVIEFLESTIAMGASPSIVSTIKYIYSDLDTSKFEFLDCSGEEQFVNSRAIRKELFRRLYTIQFVTKLFTVTIQTFPGLYTVDELRTIFILVCHLTVDKLFQSVLFDFKVLLATILDTYNSDAMWRTEVENLVRDFLSLDWHHRNLLQGVEAVLPSTKRGLHFQQVLAINVAIKIVKNREKKNRQGGDDEEEGGEGGDEEKEDEKLFLNFPVKLKLVHQILECIKSDLKDIDEESDDTDYHEISTILFLIGLCSKVELQCNPERSKMCKSIINTLTFMNDAIKECMGRHMDRTKLKNQVIRLSNKFELMKSRSESQTQSYLSSYFDLAEPEVEEMEQDEE